MSQARFVREHRTLFADEDEARRVHASAATVRGKAQHVWANAFERILGLSVRRLDRLSRFIRLRTALGWTAAETDWLLRSVGADEIGARDQGDGGHGAAYRVVLAPR